jgi:hypothetical protein
LYDISEVLNVHFTLMISVIGPVGAGKTSFAAAFAELVGYQYVPEYIDMENAAPCKKYGVESPEDALGKWVDGEWRLYTFQNFILDSFERFLDRLEYCFPLVVETPPWTQFEIFVEHEPASLISAEEKASLHERTYLISTKYRIPWKASFCYVCRNFGETAQAIEAVDGEWDVIYCNTPPEKCFENIRERGRPSEYSYTLEQCVDDSAKYDNLVAKKGVKC